MLGILLQTSVPFNYFRTTWPKKCATMAQTAWDRAASLCDGNDGRALCSVELALWVMHYTLYSYNCYLKVPLSSNNKDLRPDWDLTPLKLDLRLKIEVQNSHRQITYQLSKKVLNAYSALRDLKDLWGLIWTFSWLTWMGGGGRSPHSPSVSGFYLFHITKVRKVQLFSSYNRFSVSNLYHVHYRRSSYTLPILTS